MINYNDLHEDTRQKIGIDYLAVKTRSWHLAKAFKEAVEEMGWKYNTSFTPFTQDKFESEGTSSTSRCLYFSFDFDDMEGMPAFAISNTELDHFELPKDWNRAVIAAKQMLLENKTHLHRVELNEDYTAVVDTKQRVVRVGCQEFSFGKVLEIANIINKNSKTGQTFADRADITITFDKQTKSK